MNQEQDYFKVGTRDHIVISNSSLSYIEPEMGGSPQAFLDFFTEKNEAEKSYYRIGHLIHKWAEDRDLFAIASCPKPTEVMGVIADRVIQEIEANGVAFTRELASDISLMMGYQRNWKPETRLKNVYDGVEAYVNDYITRDEEKTYLTEAETITIESCVKSIEKHPIAKDLLFMQDVDFSNKSVFKELEIYWTKVFKFTLPSGEIIEVTVRFKAKLDSLCIDFDNKTITYTDPKTTSAGAYSFLKSFEAYKYYRQQAFYNWAIREWAKQMQVDIEGFTFKNYNIVIETNGLFQVAVYDVGPQWIFRGNNEYQKLVKRLVEHMATNQWNYSLEEYKNGMTIEIPFKEAV